MRPIYFHKKYHILTFVIVVVLVLGAVYTSRDVKTKPVVSNEPSISIYPATILPGDPVFITVTATSSVTKILFDNKSLSIFTYKGKPRALVAITFEEKVLKHEVKVNLSNRQILTYPIVITPREKIVMPVGIPEKLGGNTPAASSALTLNLARENAELNSVKTEAKILWTNRFTNPLAKIFITDNYGYNRTTVDKVIVHKGTDFRAAIGTEVKAMNRGIVRIAKEYIVYGNTIVVDHGLGVQTLYMHLSKINVKEGDTVNPGQIIGLSGMTGYAEAAHLHISVKIGGVSIDPMVFMGFW